MAEKTISFDTLAHLTERQWQAIEATDNYRYVLYGEEDRSLGWIYGREATIDDATYAGLMKRFAAAGYDTTRFLKFVQRPEQIGQPGFWSAGITPPAVQASRGQDGGRKISQ